MLPTKEATPNQIYDALVASGGNFRVAAEKLARSLNPEVPGALAATNVSDADANELQLQVAQDSEMLSTLNSLYTLQMLTDLMSTIRLISQEVSSRAHAAPIGDLLKAYPSLIGQALALMNPKAQSLNIYNETNLHASTQTHNTIANIRNQQITNIEAVLNVLPEGIREAVVRMAKDPDDAEAASIIDGQVCDPTDL